MKGNKVFPISRRCVSVDRVFPKARRNSDNKLDASCMSDTRLDERYQAPETALGGPRGSAVAPLSTSGKCAPVHHPSLFSSPHLRVARGPYGADPDVVIDSPLHSAERPLRACEIRRLFRSVQTLEKCSRTARNCKKLQRKRIVETASSQETHAVCRFAIVGSDL